MPSNHQATHARYSIEMGSRHPIVLDYRDGQGKATIREVIPLAIEGPCDDDTLCTPIYLDAFCKVAKAQRTFRFDRMASIGDARTGEIFNLNDWLQALAVGEPEPVGGSALVGDPADVQAVASALPWRDRLSLWWLTRWPIYRTALVAGGSGYAIGRFRLVRAVLRLVGTHHGFGL